MSDAEPILEVDAIRDMFVDFGAPTANMLLDEFQDALVRFSDQLSVIRQSGHTDPLRHLVHSIHGTAAMYGAVRLAFLAKAYLANTSASDIAPQDVEPLYRACLLTSRALGKLRAEQLAPAVQLVRIRAA